MIPQTTVAIKGARGLDPVANEERALNGAYGVRVVLCNGADFKLE